MLYRLVRARLAANLLAFATTDDANAATRAELKDALGLLREEYHTWLYGGPMLLQVCRAAATRTPLAGPGAAAAAGSLTRCPLCARRPSPLRPT